MVNRYPHLLSPLKVRNVILKNRMYASKALPHFIQGPENYPAAPTIEYYANLARNGAAVVTCKSDDVKCSRSEIKSRDGRHMAIYSADDPACQNYWSQLTAAIHYYGAKACISLHRQEPEEGYGISALTQEEIDAMEGHYRLFPCREMTRDEIHALAELFAQKALQFKKLGFDMCNVYMAYRSSILSCALSPATNHRTDEYGGSLENRCRLPLEVCAAIKKACGDDFLVEAQISGDEYEGGYTLEDTIGFAKLAEEQGVIDILHIRGRDGSDSHPTGFNSRPGWNWTLHIAEELKKHVSKLIIAPNGGYQDLQRNEQILAEGKADMLVMGRAFICDYDYLQKAVEGRGEDVVPCIRCNKCHVASLDGPWVSGCSVNPRMGMDYFFQDFVKPAAASRKVAVVGGGPAGMAAAMYAAQRGHQVTLFEARPILGGQLFHSDYASFKWPLRQYKDFLIAQIYKQGVEVRLNTKATPELIAGHFDAVICATGAVPKRPPIPGAELPGVTLALDVYGHEAALGRRVAVVGGSETGTETGMYLAGAGHEVTVLTRQNALATDATPIHYLEMFRDAWEALDGFSSIVNAVTTAVTENSVTYRLSDGSVHTLDCDSVVVCGGMRPLQDEAMSFGGLTPLYFTAGDCVQPANVRECVRAAFAAANNII